MMAGLIPLGAGLLLGCITSRYVRLLVAGIGFVAGFIGLSNDYPVFGKVSLISCAIFLISAFALPILGTGGQVNMRGRAGPRYNRLNHSISRGGFSFWFILIGIIVATMYFVPDFRHWVISAFKFGEQQTDESEGRATDAKDNQLILDQIAKFKNYSYEFAGSFPEIDINAYGFRLGEPRWSVISRCHDKGLKFEDPDFLDYGFAVNGVLSASGPIKTAVKFEDGRVSSVEFTFKASDETFNRLLNTLSNTYDHAGVYSHFINDAPIHLYSVKPAIGGRQVDIRLNYFCGVTDVGEERAKAYYERWRMTQDPEDLRKGIRVQLGSDEVRLTVMDIDLSYEYAELLNPEQSSLRQTQAVSDSKAQQAELPNGTSDGLFNKAEALVANTDLETVRNLEGASSQGQADSSFELARIYAKGLYGVQANENTVIKWLTKASEQGHPKAGQMLQTRLVRKAQSEHLMALGQRYFWVNRNLRGLSDADAIRGIPVLEQALRDDTAADQESRKLAQESLAGLKELARTGAGRSQEQGEAFLAGSIRETRQRANQPYRRNSPPRNNSETRAGQPAVYQAGGPSLIGPFSDVNAAYAYKQRLEYMQAAQGEAIMANLSDNQGAILQGAKQYEVIVNNEDNMFYVRGQSAVGY